MRAGSAVTTQQKQEILLVRETLELAILLSTKMRDLEGFERHMAQVKSYYAVPLQGIERSVREPLILGLNLLRLLAQNRIADFHMELELIPIEQRSNLYIKSPIDLEMHMMAGSYNKVRSSREQVPAPEYLVFMDMMMETVRREIADCSEKSYDTLNVQDAQRMLLISSEEEFAQFVGSRGWIVEGGVIQFEKLRKQKGEGKLYDTSAKDLISKTLYYARELERIV